MVQDSFAFFSEEKGKIWIDVNVWSDIKDDAFVDFGIYFFDGLKKVSLFVPFEVEDNGFEDLFAALEDMEICKGIFNAECNVVNKGTGDFFDIAVKDANELSELRVFSSKNIVKKTPCDYGTILSFEIPNDGEILGYIRFRLTFETIKGLLSQNTRGWWQEAFAGPILTKRTLYAFKINERRSLPRKVLEKSIDNINVEQVYYFLCVPEKCNVGMQDMHKMRMLESSFSKYAPTDKLKKNMDIYQAKARDEKDYNFSSTFEFTFSNWKSVGVYSLAVIVLNLISNFIFLLFKG